MGLGGAWVAPPLSTCYLLAEDCLVLFCPLSPSDLLGVGLPMAGLGKGPLTAYHWEGEQLPRFAKMQQSATRVDAALFGLQNGSCV